jgi:hypothetical protein
MTEWTRVKWGEAGQVVSVLGWDEDEDAPAVDARLKPKAYFDALVADGRYADAVGFLAQALPRLEAVAWAARTVQDLREGAVKPRSAEAEALKAALLWIQDPSEPRRRAAYQAAEACPKPTAEKLAAFAAFFSGGSIAPAEQPAVLAPRDAAGRFAAGAVLAAAAQSADMSAALKQALESGDAIAARGLAGAA